MAKLTHEQAAAVRDRLWRTTGYLVRLRERMQQVGFIHTDRLFRLVVDAEHAMRDLCMALHYVSCEGGVGQRPDQSP